MICSFCKKPVILSPSAAERARKGGGKPSDYAAMFPNHTDCELKQRSEPLPPVAVEDLPPTFQSLEMLRLRQQAAKTFGTDAGSRQTAEYVNRLPEAALRAML